MLPQQEDRSMDVAALLDADADGGPLMAVVKGTGIVRRYGEGDTAVDAARRASRLNVLDALHYE
jgi:hypothetical protein